jgi:hypothetical protein
MHYEALPNESPLLKAVIAFTEKVAEVLQRKVEEEQGVWKGNFTGQLSFEFLVRDSDLRHENSGKSGRDIKLYPIRYEPGVHSAVVLFRDIPDAMKGYVDVLEGRDNQVVNGPDEDAHPERHSQHSTGLGKQRQDTNENENENGAVFPRAGTSNSAYWIRTRHRRVAHPAASAHRDGHSDTEFFVDSALGC